MSRRLSILASAILLLFVLAAGQAAWVQYFHAPVLNASGENPRNITANNVYQRGQIVAANGTILAESIATNSQVNPWKRVYPLGALTAGVVGFSSSAQGNWALEAQYNSLLMAHTQPAQSLAQVLAPTTASDSITLTLQPVLQKIAQSALAGRDGSVVVLNPKTGDVLALYSNPTYNPAPFASFNAKIQQAAWKLVNKKDASGFPPLGLMATQQTFPPGSTFKVITTAGIVAYDPVLMTKVIPMKVFTKLPNTTQLLYNDGHTACGGTVAVMLPESCDPGYALLGLDLGASSLTAEANAFGYNSVPPLDIPGVVPSNFPAESYLAANPPFLAYSAIGQEDVRATALQNALVASAIANGGKIMTPHLLSYVSGPDGTIIKRYRDSVWKTPLSAAQAAQIVPLMQNVVKFGTAAGVGFLATDQVAAKTGTAQVGNSAKNTDDWMIAFAPASDPTVAVAVSIPFQNISVTGAEVAGPVVKCVIEGALAMQKGLPPTGTATTCAS